MDNTNLFLPKFNPFVSVPNSNQMLLKSTIKNPFFSIFKSQTLTLTLTLTLTKTLAMSNQSAPNTRRPTCPLCSRPTRVCLCTRFKSPVLENTISVTLLQHSLEKKHPLNSAKIATLGLKNINIAYVSDVISEAHFSLHLLNPNVDLGVCDSVEKSEKVESLRGSDVSFSVDKKGGVTKFLSNLEHTHVFDQVLGDKCDLGVHDLVEKGKKIESLRVKKSGVSSFEQVVVENGRKIESLQPKKGDIGSIEYNLNQNQDFERLLGDKSNIECIRNGFIVKKIGKGNDGKYVQEYEIEVPKGSVLLFPSENSIGIKDIDFDVTNLIVLDGTWGKATRMYNENLWLKLLPHLKLDIGKLSLYGEVRRQPKARCLSSIESIVYALKAIGEDVEGLDCLLDVFESMVSDQRRCKNERLEFESTITSI